MYETTVLGYGLCKWLLGFCKLWFLIDCSEITASCSPISIYLWQAGKRENVTITVLSSVVVSR